MFEKIDKYSKIIIIVVPIITGSIGFAVNHIIGAAEQKVIFEEKIKCLEETEKLKQENVNLYKDNIKLQSSISFCD